MKKYNRSTAPEYNLTKLKNANIPMFLINGAADVLADQNDVNMLVKLLAKNVKKVLTIEDYGHCDYMWA